MFSASDVRRRRYIIAWQLLLLGLATSWLWAPHLNNLLTYRNSLISQYEASIQPFSWLFRTGDVLGSLLVLLMAYVLFKLRKDKLVCWLLVAIGIGMFLDPLLPTTCRVVGNVCTEYFSLSFFVHAVETVITAGAFFVIAVYDAWLRKRLVSISFAIFQIGYGILFLSQLADKQQFNTVSQYIYQTILIVWLAWFCRDFLKENEFLVSSKEGKFVRNAAAVWAFFNGILAILISLAHIHLLGKIKGLYFAGDSAWLAQHGVIIGVVMLYLSRHLARGELRARQIFLIITGLETLKYSVVSPNPGLMSLYFATFCLLFVLRDDFDRGVIPMTWQVRIRDLYFMVSALLLAALAALLSLDRDSRIAEVVGRTFHNFYKYVAASDIAVHSHQRSVLLAHTISAFLVVSIGSILWILFRPYKAEPSTQQDINRLENLLKLYSNSPEDFFKLWPSDKEYFWQMNGQGFIAFKKVGPIAFTLADPISQDPNVLLDEFISWAKSRRLKVCFLPIYGRSLESYKNAGLEPIQIGSSAVIDIHDFLTTTVKDKWWRWQRNRAEKNGYVYEQSVPPHSSAFLKRLKVVSDAWLAKPGHEERGFALGYFDEEYLQKCTLHYLRNEHGKILAFTNQLPGFGVPVTVTVDLLRYLPEANNTMPYLLYKTIEAVAEEGKLQFFDLGFVPFAGAKGPILTIAKTLSAGRFSARGLEQFKNKFKPNWQANYIAYEGDLADLTLVGLNLDKAMKPKWYAR